MKYSFNAYLILLLFLTGCSKKSEPVSVEVFVATRGGQNYKLGSVSVHILKRESYDECVRNFVAQKESDFQQLGHAYAEWRNTAVERRSEYRETLENIEKAKRSFDGYLRLLGDIGRVDESTLEIAPRNGGEKFNHLLRLTEVQRKQFNSLLLKSKGQMRELLNDEQQQMHWVERLRFDNRAAILELIDALQVEFAAVTNADGIARFDLPTQGDYIVIARATRVTPDSSSEVYTWIVSLPKERSTQASRTIILSNTNMVDQVSGLEKLSASNGKVSSLPETREPTNYITPIGELILPPTHEWAVPAGRSTQIGKRLKIGARVQLEVISGFLTVYGIPEGTELDIVSEDADYWYVSWQSREGRIFRTP